MKLTRFRYIEILSMLPTLFLVPLLAFAQISNPITTPSLSALLVAIIDFIITVSVPIVVIAIVFAGFQFVTAGGNEQKLSSAKRVLFWALIGALILFGARVLAEVVCNTVESISSQNICT